MINYYLRPDSAHIKIDDTNKTAINVLNNENHKFIGRISDPQYVDNMISIVDKFTPIDEATFESALQEAKTFLSNL